MKDIWKESRGQETCKILHSKLHSYPGSAVSPAASLRFISMVSNSSGKYGIHVVRGNTNKNRQVILLRSLRFSVTVFPLRGYLVLSQRSHQFLLGLGFNRRALRVRLVTVVKRNSSSGSTRPFGWRFMKWTSCCLCVVREPFLGRPFRLKPRYHPLYLADTRAV
ncbi:hypothetical protein XENOCAPTIV_017853 [Xenoophorus captivus]|uniref:Uncharacterized protein n=1 Tax=Xenoophorus captivus TaxID=1517983 RepID=A0ABV0S2D9_9TELE